MREVIITDHAKERMVERGVCKAHKCLKLATKAWKHKSETKKLNKIQYKRERKQEIRLREIMGFVYVFDIQYPGKAILVTVYNL